MYLYVCVWCADQKQCEAVDALLKMPGQATRALTQPAWPDTKQVRGVPARVGQMWQLIQSPAGPRGTGTLRKCDYCWHTSLRACMCRPRLRASVRVRRPQPRGPHRPPLSKQGERDRELLCCVGQTSSSSSARGVASCLCACTCKHVCTRARACTYTRVSQILGRVVAAARRRLCVVPRTHSSLVGMLAALSELVRHACAGGVFFFAQVREFGSG